MAISVPCILTPFLGSELLGGATTGAIEAIVDGVPYAGTFPAAGAIDLEAYYYLSGDGTSSDLLQLLEDALNGLGSGETFDVSQDGAGQVTIECSIAWRLDGPNTELDLSLFGLDNDALHPDPAATTLEPASLHAGAWFPGEPESFDSLHSLPTVAGAARTLAGQTRVVKLATGTVGKERELGWTAIDGARVREDLATTATLYAHLEAIWRAHVTEGRPLRFYEDASVRTANSYLTYRARDDGLGDPWSRNGDEHLWWDVLLRLVRVD